MGLKTGWFPLGNGVCLIMKKAPSDSPIWQPKKRELLLSLYSLITKPIILDLSNFHYRPHYKPHYRTQGCVIRENNITHPIANPVKDILVPLWTNFNVNGSVRWHFSFYLNLFNWPMGKILGIVMGFVDTFQHGHFKGILLKKQIFSGLLELGILVICICFR